LNALYRGYKEIGTAARWLALTYAVARVTGRHARIPELAPAARWAERC